MPRLYRCRPEGASVNSQGCQPLAASEGWQPPEEISSMARSQEPVVLELAALPREQMGPFLILGLDKNADKVTAERHWADRIKWARRQLIKVALEDINWARDVMNDTER